MHHHSGEPAESPRNRWSVRNMSFEHASCDFRDRRDRSRILHGRRWRWGNESGTRSRRRWWVATQDLPRSAAHPFYTRLNQILDEHDFDKYVEELCQRFYSDEGRPGLPPGRYFRLLAIGYFEGLDAERAIGSRAADSFALREFLGLVLPEASPEQPVARGPRSRGCQQLHLRTRSRGRRNWKDKPEARTAVYRNRRRIRGPRGLRLLRLPGSVWNGPSRISTKRAACAACICGGTPTLQAAADPHRGLAVFFCVFLWLLSVPCSSVAFFCGPQWIRSDSNATASA